MTWRGRLEEHTFESRALRGNKLGDPHLRPLWVQLPAGYDDDPARRYPVVYQIQGLTGQLDMWRNRTAFRPTYLELAETMIARGEIPPVIQVYVDCWTSLGGSQFLDSPATGQYHTYLCDEIVPWVDAHYRTLPAAAHRGIAGKSSGGYGAVMTAMLRPELFGGFASHAGGFLIEVAHVPKFYEVVRALRDHYDGSYARFWEDFRQRPPMSRETDVNLVLIWVLAASFSPTPEGEVQLPFNLRTGQLIPEVFARWQAHDPVRLIPARADALRGMKAIYLDAGDQDEWLLDLAAVAFAEGLDAIGVHEYFCEIFPARHGGIEYRYPISLRYLAERLSP